MFAPPHNQAVVVARVSSPKQQQGHGLPRQVEGNTLWASAHGLSVVDTVQQVGSASTPRCAIDAIIHAHTLGAQWLVYEHIDRVARCDTSAIYAALYIYTVRIALVTPSISVPALRSSYGENAVRLFPVVQEGMPFAPHEEFSEHIWID